MKETGLFEAAIVDRSTGQERTIEVRAQSEAEAQAKLAKMNATVGDIRFVRFEYEAEVPATPSHSPQRESEPGPPRVQTIEQTGKDWKALYAIGVVLLIIGIFVAFGASDAETPVPGVIGALTILAGLILIMVGRMGAWWHHK